MLLNIQKLFPKACKSAGITHLKINYEDITSFRRELSADIKTNTYDIIELKDGSIYKFEPVDTGLIILDSIRAAKETLTEAEQTRMLLAGLPEDYVKHRKNAALNYLQKAISLFGA